MRAIARYREFAPSDALRPHVRAIFSFVPDCLAAPPERSLRREIVFSDLRSCSPQFADGHASMLFEIGRTCTLDGHWQMDSSALGGTVTGPKTVVGRIAAGDLPQMLGILFRPSEAVASLVGVPLRELANRVVGIDDAWGVEGKGVAGGLAELEEDERIERNHGILF